MEETMKEPSFEVQFWRPPLANEPPDKYSVTPRVQCPVKLLLALPCPREQYEYTTIMTPHTSLYLRMCAEEQRKSQNKSCPKPNSTNLSN